MKIVNAVVQQIDEKLTCFFTFRVPKKIGPQIKKVLYVIQQVVAKYVETAFPPLNFKKIL